MSNKQQLSETINITQDARSIAAVSLAQIFRHGRSSSTVLPKQLKGLDEPTQRALIQELFYGVLRWAIKLEAIAQQLLHKPIKRQDTDIYCLILLGLYQLLNMRIPAHAVVAETVSAVNGLGKPWAKGLVNAVLRQMQRQQSSILARIDNNEEAITAHPLWLLERIRSHWPDDWQQIIDTNNQRPVMHLRVNINYVNRDDYLDILHKAGIAAQPSLATDCGLVLDKTIEVGKLPGFADGWVSIQDSAAQLAAFLLEARPGDRVLDACAAPGGKACHILELQPQLQELIAIDIDEQRLQRVQQNLDRLNSQAHIVCGDAACPDDWWDGVCFDRILLDAPCSATGVIRRHPDIKRLRRAEDIEPLVRQQQNLLEVLWPLLKTGGMLLYATCSIFPDENDQQMLKFLDIRDDASEKRIEADWGRPMPIGRQVLPGDNNMDGFYYACLQKIH